MKIGTNGAVKLAFLQRFFRGITSQLVLGLNQKLESGAFLSVSL
jgi:hypothetical protein